MHISSIVIKLTTLFPLVSIFNPFLMFHILFHKQKLKGCEKDCIPPTKSTLLQFAAYEFDVNASPSPSTSPHHPQQGRCACCWLLMLCNGYLLIFCAIFFNAFQWCQNTHQDQGSRTMECEFNLNVLCDANDTDDWRWLQDSYSYFLLKIFISCIWV